MSQDQPPRCRVCGGEVRLGEPAVGEGTGQTVHIRNPRGARAIPWIGERPQAPCTARVCLRCGYIELFTRDPQQLIAR